jgi:hypothetical protein
MLYIIALAGWSSKAANGMERGAQCYFLLVNGPKKRVNLTLTYLFKNLPTHRKQCKSIIIC